MSHASSDARPRLRTSCGRARPVTFVVFAPFGTDETLSDYPDGLTRSVHDHPLVHELQRVARLGVDVCALIDRHDDDTWLVDIDAHRRPQWSTAWKQDMSQPQPLERLLIHALRRHPGHAIVLAIEGHGAGFVPDIDLARLAAWRPSPAPSTGAGPRWLSDPSAGGASRAVRTDGAGGVSTPPPAARLPGAGSPVLPTGHPPLPGMAAPAARLPISTWGLGHALHRALDACGAERIEVVHFDNCFNFSVETLHTVAPSARVAAGYMNYNFFTAGRGYAEVFAQLARAGGTASAHDLGRWFCEGNRNTLGAKALPHPTIGGAVALERLGEIAAAIDALAGALIDAMPDVMPGRVVTPGDEPVRDAIQATIEAAAQYDSRLPLQLETPDALTDPLSWARQLVAAAARGRLPAPVGAAAAALADALRGLKIYGAAGVAWMATQASDAWDFTAPDLAVNLFLPDPTRAGIWDWRAPYYLGPSSATAAAAAGLHASVQRHVIEFLRTTRWAAFVDKYHQGVPFTELQPAALPIFPTDRPQGPARGDGRRPPAQEDLPTRWNPDLPKPRRDDGQGDDGKHGHD